MPFASAEDRREYQRLWNAKRRHEWFAGKSCVRCGTTDELRLDHIDPKQKITHRVWSWSQERREAELAKCQVLCEPCHKEKTMDDCGYSRHGSAWAYAQGCHCVDCTLANTEKKRRARARKRSSLNRQKQSA